MRGFLLPCNAAVVENYGLRSSRVVCCSRMGYNTRANHVITEEETPVRRSSSRLAAASVSAVGDSSSLRKSARETSSKKTLTPQRPTNRESESLEKHTPSPPITRSSIKKPQAHTPLRRSLRGKKLDLTLNSLGSKNSGTLSSDAEKMEEEIKEDFENDLGQRSVEATAELGNTLSTRTRKGNMDAHAYKALFRKQKKRVKLSVHHDDSSSSRNSPAEDFCNSSGHNSKKLDVMENHQSNNSQCQKLFSAEQLESPKNPCYSETLHGHIVHSLSSPDDKRMSDESSLKEILPIIIDSRSDGTRPDGEGCTDVAPEVVDDASSVFDSKQDAPGLPLSRLTESASVKESGLNVKRKSGELEDGLNLIVNESFTKNDGQLEKQVQVTTNEGWCFACKIGGLLLCCDGKDCNRSFHLSCLIPTLKGVPLGIWYCPICVRKKMEFGTRSVSKGIEAILDVKDLEISDTNGLQVQRQFFVKYKGLSHIHNLWVSETEVLNESPSVVARFDKKGQTVKWKPEWTKPHRLLDKRLETFSQHDRAGVTEMVNSHHQWLVKWCGLGYEDATWELEDEPFFSSSEVMNLIKEYEARHKRAKRPLVLEIDQPRERKSNVRGELSKLPDGISAGSDTNCLVVVNTLRKFWQKSQNAIIIDDQEYMQKVIAFITSLQSDAFHPFLIISSSNSFISWEMEFFHLSRSTNVVVYNGDKLLRQSIRNMEFFGEGGATMFQVLLSAPKAISEDMAVLRLIKWEAVIIDECQRSVIIRYAEEFKMLKAEMRILLYMGPLKESASEYSGLLSLLDNESSWRSWNGFGASDSILKCKERLSYFILWGSKDVSSRFVEYWVPVQLSNVQLEQYCATLLSNCLTLRSSSRNDPVGALRDVVTASRKCCDHPYLGDVDFSLRTLLMEDFRPEEYLNVGLKASGKLELMDKLLPELKSQGLRVLIMFQSISHTGKDVSIGDILDDFIRQRFGEDSYERIDGDVPRKKKLDAMNSFNKKDFGRFVFLLEARACLSAIKLTSVDVVILLGSDWNPVNDIRNLQKIQLESQFEQIPVFRLYSSCTVEEKALINAKNGDSSMSNTMHPISSHSLLMWGANHLFAKLEDFHRRHKSSCAIADGSHIKDVLQELLNTLPGNDESGSKTESSSLSLISRARQGSETYYSKETTVLGESTLQSPGEESPHLFWSKLLEGKAPTWKFVSISRQRNRKRFQTNGSSYAEQEVSDESVRKRRKVCENNVEVSSKKQGKDEGTLAPASKEAASGDVQLSSQERNMGVPACDTNKSDDRTLPDRQRRLHFMLKPQILRLCEALNLEDEVKNMVCTFLNYVMNNFAVSQEPGTVLQAFQLAMCWTASSLVKLKIDHRESFSVAKEQLSYTCSQDEAEVVYRMLKGLKKQFHRQIEDSEAVEVDTPKAAEEVTDIPMQDSAEHLSRHPVVCFPNMKAEIDEQPVSEQFSDRHALSSPTLDENDTIITIEIPVDCSEQMAKLLMEQQEERRKIYNSFKEEKANLENELMVKLYFTKSLHREDSVRSVKLKAKEDEYCGKINECKNQLKLRLKELEEAHLDARNKLLQKEASSADGEEAQQALLSGAAAISEAARHQIASAVTENEHENSAPDTVPEHAVEAGSSGQDHGNAIPVDLILKYNVMDRTATDVQGGESAQGQKTDGTATVQNEEVPWVIFENSQYILVEDVVPQKESSTLSNGDVSETPAVIHSTGMRSPEILVFDNIQDTEDQTRSVANALRLVADIESAHCQPEDSDIEMDSVVHAPLIGEQDIEGSTLEASGDFPTYLLESAPDDDLNGAEGACEHHEDGPSPVITNNDMSVDSLDILGQQMTSENGTIPVNQSSTEERAAASLSLHVETASPDPEVSITEPVLQVSGLSNEHTADGMMDGDSWNVGMDFQEVADQSSSQPSIPSALQMEESNVAQPTNPPDSGAVETEVPMRAYSASTVQMEECNLAQPTNPPDSGAAGTEVPMQMPASSASAVQMEESNVSQLPNPPDPGAVGMEVPMQVPASCASNGQVADGMTHEDGQVGMNTGDDVNQYGSQSSVPSALQMAESSAVQPSNPPEPESNTVAQPSFLPEPQAAGMEMDTHPGPSHLQRTDLVTHESSRDSATNVQGTLHQSGSQPSLPFDLETATAPLNPLEFSSLTAQSTLTSSSRMAKNMSSDPLQNELGRLRLESDLTAKIHEEIKSKLRADCEKEIEILVAQVRMKYEMKIQENETEYVRKKNELQKYQDKVLMNKILAEAFRSKCRDFKASGAHTAQQADAMATYMQQILSSSQQQNLQASASFISRSSSHSRPPNNMYTPTSAVNQFSQQSRQPMNPAPPVHSPRPPVIGQFPSPGNVQVQREVRGPAPHLQSIRTSLPQIPCATPLPRPPSNTPDSISSRTPWTGHISGRMTNLNSPAFPVELFRDLTRRHQQQPGNFQLPVLNLTNLGGSLDIGTSSKGNNAGADVVCLSDDD